MPDWCDKSMPGEDGTAKCTSTRYAVNSIRFVESTCRPSCRKPDNELAQPVWTTVRSSYSTENRSTVGEPPNHEAESICNSCSGSVESRGELRPDQLRALRSGTGSATPLASPSKRRKAANSLLWRPS